MKESKLPKTDSIQELAEFWDTHDLTDFEDELAEVSGEVFMHNTAIKACQETREVEVNEKMVRSTIRRRRWYRWLSMLAGVLLLLYVGSYAMLYRRGVDEAESYSLGCFAYIPMAEVEAAEDLTPRHARLAQFYDPLNQLHRRWFGGECPCRCILFRLGR